MARSWINRLLNKKSGPTPRTGPKKSSCARFVPAIESLADRVLPSVRRAASRLIGIMGLRRVERAPIADFHRLVVAKQVGTDTRRGVRPDLNEKVKGTG